MKSALQCISFLDVCIKVNNDNIDTRIWHIPTHTGLFLNFNVNCPKWKSRLILCLLHKVKNNFLFFNKVGVLRNMFVFNGHQLWFFEKCFNKLNEKCLHFHSSFCDHVYNLNIS